MLLKDYLRDKRVSAGFDLSEASQQLGYQDFKFLSNVELGIKLPTTDLLLKMCDVYGVSPAEMREVYINEAKSRATASAAERWDND
ncbi:helix-turn-helix domain-containing protein [Bdellovibrio sp. SKB1291214]|uniref:helix-turn-helix domain-containing protein n=1 Tax=Bdellovibrio sp. SKB1291214 TaxID=1732569 RepID=UPI000B51717C|nr:helix-turn-helix transcriptional regulator [Bdellovibrio sp. SKB1291214]UYL07905.1 helix-turn-helix domain-containing protein [Bdellovibrio sp. SKB1291214]